MDVKIDPLPPVTEEPIMIRSFNVICQVLEVLTLAERKRVIEAACILLDIK